MKILETFDGFLDRIDGGIGYATIRGSGQVFWVEIPAVDLEANGIQERRKFILQTVEKEDGEVSSVYTAVAEKILTPEDYKRIESLVSCLGEDDCPQDDY